MARVRKSKMRAKVSEEAEAMTVDRLSDLSDSLLSHILSFLPTEQVVAMSILSKRWQNVWRFVETIDFSTSSDSFREEQFARVVYGVMLSHKGECIRRMTLRCFGDKFIANSDVRRWMSFALNHGVECFDLMFSFVINPPRLFFTSKTLVKLKIGYVDITTVNVPNAPFLVKLKELRLEDPKWDTESLKRFITGCPTLEYFSLIMSNLGVWTFDICSPTLKRLELKSPEAYTSLKVGKILLTAPALQFFLVQHPVSDIIIEDKLSSLVETDISIAIDSCHEIVSRFLQSISNVKILRLRTFDEPVTSDMHAEFPNLTKLVIVSPHFELTFVQIFLEAAMNLEDITMEMRSDWQELQVPWNEPLYVPKCLLSSLKKMSIKGYEGGKNDLAMVNYVLRNAEVLQMMEIRYPQCYDYDSNYEKRYRMVQRITEMNRGSKSCKISFR